MDSKDTKTHSSARRPGNGDPAWEFPDDVGFLQLLCGGTGLAAAPVFYERYEADAETFPVRSIQIDTDPKTNTCIDTQIDISLSGERLEALRADPDRFGSTTRVILSEFAKYLDPDDIRNGSRTIRPLTQLAFLFHRPRLIREIRRAVQLLCQNNRIKQVIPFLVSSTGGGAGSAGQILLMRELSKPSTQRFLCEGLPPNILSTPISFVADPYAMAIQHSDDQHARIMANAFAFRVESEALERAGRIKNIFHIGMSNRFGVMLTQPDQIGWVLGTCLYEFQRNWSELKGRIVDPTAAKLGSRYLGRDLPELVLKNRNETAAKGVTP